jgi:hypothetical protein
MISPGTVDLAASERPPLAPAENGGSTVICGERPPARLQRMEAEYEPKTSTIQNAVNADTSRLSF